MSMTAIIRNGCNFCKHLQYVQNFPKTWYYYFYSRTGARNRGAGAGSRGMASSSYYRKKQNTEDEEVVCKKNRDVMFQSYLEETRQFENVAHGIVDREMYDYMLNTYFQKQKEIDKSEQKFPSVNSKRTRKIVKPKAIPEREKYEKGKQLTRYGVDNIISEIDIYLFLGDFMKAEAVFDFHRRQGHSFDVEVYNKILHVLAVQNKWPDIQQLRYNMDQEQLTPTYQTYAALLEACGNISREAFTPSDVIMDIKHIVDEMSSRGMQIEQLLKESCLSKQQIESILTALHMIGRGDLDSRIHADITQTMEDESISDFVAAQIESELKGEIPVKSVERPRVLPIRVKKRVRLYEGIIEQWKKDFLAEVVRLQQMMHTKNDLYTRCVTFASVLPADELTKIMFNDIVPLIASNQRGIKIGQLIGTIGDKIYTKFALRYQETNGVVEKVDKVAKVFFSTDNNHNEQRQQQNQQLSHRQRWEMISEKFDYLPKEDLRPNPWSKKIKSQASSVLLDILEKVAIVDTTSVFKAKNGKVEQALTHEIEVKNGRKYKSYKFHPAICRLYQNYLQVTGNLEFNVNILPMITPPKPWINPSIGGYLLLPTHLVRLINYKPSNISYESHDLSKVYDSLNYVGNTAWKVNGRLLDLMIELFNGAGDDDLAIIGSEKMLSLKKEIKQNLKTKDYKKLKPNRKEYHELHALRMDLLYKLSVADHFRNDAIWLPNNVDFRGRAYPVPPHCSHIGHDISRSMLVFNIGKKLGKDGLNWLKVHLVNVNGQLKKSSLQERIDFADLHIEDIMDSADNPLTGKKWWKKSSDPWQTLIACMEITDAIRSGDPESFVSHLPIQQDGSCNGLQHYAALGRDVYGAKQVNLTLSDRPQDVYAEVAVIVEKLRQKDADEGVLIAQQLEGLLNRKVVKQTVMTVVYGVTFFGAKGQIEKQLKALDVSNEISGAGASYLAHKVFESLRQMFTSARQIQDWLTTSAVQISLSGNCVEWVSPVNLPIIQPYHKKVVERILTPLQEFKLTTQLDDSQLPNMVKQKGGFAPNFIHSLDSSHMMMTALRMQQENLIFASVHDSFWTHACDVKTLNKFCREEFIHLHKMPILEDVKRFFDEKYNTLPLRRPFNERTVCEIDELPDIGELDIDEVKRSVYFFS